MSYTVAVYNEYIGLRVMRVHSKDEIEAMKLSYHTFFDCHLEDLKDVCDKEDFEKFLKPSKTVMDVFPR